MILLLKNCIIAGSWAMFFYKEIFEGFIPPIATTDFDIFLPSVLDKVKDENKRENIEIQNANPSDEAILEVFNSIRWK